MRELGRPEDALAAFDAAIRLAPDYADGHSNRGAALMDLGRLDEALAAFERALALKPDHSEAHQNAGGAYLRLNQPDRALAACDAAIRAHPRQRLAPAASDVRLPSPARGEGLKLPTNPISQDVCMP